MGTTGNEHGHVVLRGGRGGPNYSATHLAEVTELLLTHKLSPRVLVDCSHANSGKNPARQALVAADLAGQIAGGQTAIAGVMLESNLLGGCQSLDAVPLVYGRSITDACLGWEQTLPIFDQLARAVKARRER
jgi:3-deoxy-7-phosphoheptulonate synthase